jgi:hypothetical protein
MGFDLFRGDKPYPTIQSIKTILDWSKHPRANRRSRGVHSPQFVERLDKEGFIASIFKK